MQSNENLIGWREWVSLPELGIEKIICKVDTGAKNSALHAFEIDPFEKQGESWIRFYLHPDTENTEYIQECEARVFDKRQVTDSSGNRAERFFIETLIRIGDQTLKVPVSLTARDTMKYKMLLGRTAIRRSNYLVDTKHSFLQHSKGDIL